MINFFLGFMCGSIVAFCLVVLALAVEYPAVLFDVINKENIDERNMPKL